MFAVALMATLLAGFSFAMHSIKKEHMDLFFKSRLIVKEMRITHQVPQALLEEFEFNQVHGLLKKEILHKSKKKKSHTKAMPKQMQKRFRAFEKHRKVLHYQGKRYIHLKTRHLNIVLEDRRSVWSCCPALILFFLGILILLIVMYMLLRKNLIPLKTLQEDIEKYGNGQEVRYQYIDKKDEVSLASNSFYASIEKVEQLRDSRQLFIRNIFHELNTPVTKGKILAEIVEEDKTKEMLNSIFTRLSILLKELAQMEKITSEDMTIVKKPIRIQELIDEASDLLYLDEPIKTNVSDQMIDADFSLMRIVFKNLIDNALKHGEDIEIQVSENTISFLSSGERLTEEIDHYIEPFSKNRQLDKAEGLGLGLYIVNEVLKKHEIVFSYTYKSGKNIFIISY